ncbi:MAG TPA: helix-turn-helix domain-containing protein [Bryobacteraceae bacterium]|jgi:AraC-like DNA-binding protein|nr:helix-turn-helix domain-containing protein [Bryobacteraceae bacterium]
MRFYHHIPAPPLSEFVGLLWLYEGYHQPHEKERLLPDGSMELVINLNEDLTRFYHPHDTGKFETLRGSVVVGAHSEFFVIDTAEQHSVAGVHFKPGGAFPFLGLPAGELHNALVSLQDLWGGLADQLRERLLEAGTPQARLLVLEQALLAKAAQRLERHPAVAFALREFHGLPHTPTIADVTGQIGLSAKRFIQVFSGEVGLTPKLFCRVRRFQRVLRRIGTGRPVEWAAVAADCGYFDQAHFIHDFHAFSGINPSTYIAHRTEHLNHVPLIE